MVFAEVIKEIVEGVPGCEGGVIMDLDGITLESYTRPGMSYDLQSIGIEFANIIREVKKASAVLDAGNLKELTVNTEGATLLLRNLTAEYFLALILREGALVGKVRYLARQAAPKLVAEL